MKIEVMCAKCLHYFMANDWMAQMFDEVLCSKCHEELIK